MLYRNFATEAEINAEYDPGMISDRVQAIDRFERMSEAATKQITNWYSCQFGPTEAEYVDVFPSGIPNGPVHIFIHGGYWRALSTREFAFVAQVLVQKGITVVLTNYGLCPDIRLSDIVDQTRRAVSWVAHNALKLNIDSDRLSLSGHSAGGHLVAMMLATDWSDYGLPRDLIKGSISLSGLFDLRPFPHSWLQPTLALSVAEVEDNSPLFLPVCAKAKVTLLYGELEQSEFARQSIAYSEHLASNNVTVDCLAIEKADHFTELDLFVQEESDFVKEIVRFGQEDSPG